MEFYKGAPAICGLEKFRFDGRTLGGVESRGPRGVKISDGGLITARVENGEKTAISAQNSQ